jgi:hypothetical protein
MRNAASPDPKTQWCIRVQQYNLFMVDRARFALASANDEVITARRVPYTTDPKRLHHRYARPKIMKLIDDGGAAPGAAPARLTERDLHSHLRNGEFITLSLALDSSDPHVALTFPSAAVASRDGSNGR